MPTNDEMEASLIRTFGFDWVSYKVWIVNHTANQIFTELKKYDKGYGDIVLSKEDLHLLKKQFKVD